MARFSESVSPSCRTTSRGCSKTVPGCKSALKSKTLSSAVVGRMGSSCSLTIVKEAERFSCRAASTSALSSLALSRLGFQLLHVVPAAAIDGDAPRLHRFRHLAHELNGQEPVVEGCVLDLHVIRKAELALEIAGRDSPMQKLPLAFLGPRSLDRDGVLLGRDRDVFRRETGDRQ